MLNIHEPKSENNNITTARKSDESHFCWKRHFHKNPLYFRIDANFEADSELDNSSIVNKTTNIYKQNPMPNGYHIESELDDVLKRVIKVESDKVRNHCHLTGKYRGVAHRKCKINVTQKQSNFIPFIVHNFSNHDCHMFFRKLFDKKNDKVKFDIIPKTNEEYISVTYDCIRFIDDYRFLSSGLDSLVKTLVDNSHKTFKN